LAVSRCEALDQRVAVGDVGRPHAGEEREGLGACERRPQVGLAGDVGDVPVGGDRVAPGVDAEELGTPASGLVQAEQEPDGGRLPGAVGPRYP
jgi:hypothetical protein